MAIADFWFHDDEAVAGSQSKKEVMKKVKRSRLRDYLSTESAPAALPSAYEVKQKIMKPAKKEEKKKTTKDKIIYKG